MSLNGLDAPELKDAHDVAAAEPGGWFLLQYAGRDAVELLGKGSGGIVEIRNAIAQYEEPSPLYGFLRYRRRNVIIKYLPDNCSRLVQARVSVHLDSVCERFSPYDTVFEIVAAKELKDTRLSAACSLHTASGSMSSSTSSLRRRRLMEIAEEEEEEQRATKRQSVGATDEANWVSPQQEPPVALDLSLADSPEASQFSGADEPPAFVGAPRPASPARSLDATGSGYVNTGRSDLSGYHSSSSFSPRPKVKLGPRPSLDTSGRPRTAAGGTFRPVSTIPAGFKMMSKTGKKDRLQGADEEQADADGVEDSAEEKPPEALTQPGDAVFEESAAEETVPDTNTMPHLRPHTSGGRSTVGSAGVKTGVSGTAKPGATGQTMISPEKSRLMKAMQLREKKKKEQEAVTAATTESAGDGDGSWMGPDRLDSVVPTLGDTAAVEEPPGLAMGQDQDGACKDGKSLAEMNDGAAEDQAPPGSGEETTDDRASLLLPDRASLDAQSDSHPASPLVASSEIGNSTKASSVSESTDETALGSKGGGAEAVDERGDDRPRTATPAAEDHGAHTSDAPISATMGLESIPAHNNEGSGDPDGHVSGAPLATLAELQSNVPTSKASEASEEQQPAKASPESATVTGTIQNNPSLPGDELELVAAPEEDSAQPEEELKRPKAPRATSVDPIRTGQELETVVLADEEDTVKQMQSAMLHEARPRLESKSPITPVFPPLAGGPGHDGNLSPLFNNSSADGPGPAIKPARVSEASSPIDEVAASVRSVSRAVSNPASRGQPPGGSDAPPLQPPMARAASSGPLFLQKVAQQRPGSSSSVASVPGSAPAKKIGMGSSISQRIKALEKLSSASGGLAAPVSVPERPQSAFFAVRPPSVREPSRSPSVAERASSLRVEKTTPSPPRPSDRDSSVAGAGSLRERSGSISSRLSVFEGGSMPRGRPESIQVTARIVRDPVQSLNKASEQARADAGEPGMLDLRHSPLVIDHHRPSTSPSGETSGASGSRKATIRQRRLSRDKRRSRSAHGDDDGGAAVDNSSSNENGDESEATSEGRPRRRSSLTVVKDFIKDRRSSVRGAKSPSTDNLSLGHGQGANPGPNAAHNPSRSPSRPPSTHHNSVFPQRVSISSPRSSMTKDRDGIATPLLSPSHTIETNGSGDEAMGRLGDGPGQKKASSGSGSSGKSRASRFIRRLSNSLSSSRKNVTPARSPTVAEEASDGDAGPAMASSGYAAAQNQQQPAVVAYMRDVNVQFPDNLLWKRRTMCLDSQGFLILSAGQGAIAAGSAGVTKRYHLSDFRAPYTPEMEQQELPNSICLDFVDGSSLQIACEDRPGQLATLQELQAAHQSHTTFGQ